MPLPALDPELSLGVPSGKGIVVISQAGAINDQKSHHPIQIYDFPTEKGTIASQVTGYSGASTHQEDRCESRGILSQATVAPAFSRKSLSLTRG